MYNDTIYILQASRFTPFSSPPHNYYNYYHHPRIHYCSSSLAPSTSRCLVLHQLRMIRYARNANVCTYQYLFWLYMLLYAALGAITLASRKSHDCGQYESVAKLQRATIVLQFISSRTLERHMMLVMGMNSMLVVAEMNSFLPRLRSGLVQKTRRCELQVRLKEIRPRLQSGHWVLL